MTEDARNSIKLWAGGIAVAALAWILFQWDPWKRALGERPPTWFWLVTGAAAIFNLARFGWGLWKRRASRSR